MRTLVIGDIHGEYDKLMQVLKKADYAPLEDKIVFLGDYIDRGSDSFKVVKYIQDLKVNFPENVVLLKGNHEDMALKFINSKISQRLYVDNGGNKTVDNYNKRADMPYGEFKADIKGLNNLPAVHETNKYIFVHAGLKPGIPLYQQKEKDMLWIRDEFLNADRWLDKIIIHGHTPVKEVFFGGWRVNLDTGAGKGGKLSLLDLSNGKVYEND